MAMIDQVTKEPLPEDKQHLILENRGFAFQVAMEYCPTDRQDDFNDMLQWAQIGLIEAAHRWRPEEGYTFITYAVHWIRRYCIEQAQQRTVRKPQNHHNPKLRHIDAALAQKLGRFPTDNEVFGEAGVTDKVGVDQLAAFEPTSSLDYVAPDSKVPYVDIVAPVLPTQDEDLEEDEMIQVVQDAIKRLAPREQKIIQMYSSGLTLNDIGVHFDLTRERIRQIKEIAYRKLRQILRQEINLEDYFGDMETENEEHVVTDMDRQLEMCRRAAYRHLKREGF